MHPRRHGAAGAARHDGGPAPAAGLAQGAARARHGRGARPRRSATGIAGRLRALAGGARSRACSATSWPAGSPTGSTSPAPTAPTDAACASSLAALSPPSTSCRWARSDLVITGGVDTLERHPHVHVLQQDAGAVADRRLPAVLRPRPTARCSARARDVRAQAARRRRARRRPDLRRDPRHRRLLRRPGKAIYAPRARGPGARAAARLRGGRLRPGDGRAGRGPRHRHQGRRRRRVRPRWARSSARPAGADRQWCALGSVKSQIGHTKAAAGAAGLLKAVLALHHKVLPPTIKVDRPNPALGPREAARSTSTPRRGRGCGAAGRHPRRASVSSFGFGGTNFHVALEEYVPAPGRQPRLARRLPAAPTELILISAAGAWRTARPGPAA